MLTIFNTFIIYFYLSIFIIENIFGFSVTAIRGISLNNMGVFLIVICLLMNSIFRRNLIYNNKLYFFLALMVLYLFISIPIKFMHNEIPIRSVLGEILAIKQISDPWVLFFLISNIIIDEKLIKRTITGLLFVLGVSILITLLAVFNIATIGTVYTAQGRTAGFTEPNQYAALLVLFIPLLVSISILNKTSLKRAIGGCFCLMACIALVCTGSRGGFISLGFSMLAYLFFIWREGVIKRISTVFFLILLPVAIFLSYAIIPQNFKRTIQNRINPEYSEDINFYTSGRTTLWENGIQLFLDRPIYGHGIHTFRPLLMERFQIDKESHNEYLMYLVEYGIIGLLIFLSIYFQIFRFILGSIRDVNDRSQKIYFISYICGAIGFVVAFFGINLYNQIRIMFWIYTAAIYRYTAFERKTIE